MVTIPEPAKKAVFLAKNGPVLDLVVSILEQQGYTVGLARDPAAVAAQLASSRHQLLVWDASVCGLEALAATRDPGIPTLALVELSPGVDLNALGGADQALSFPFTDEEFCCAIGLAFDSAAVAAPDNGAPELEPDYVQLAIGDFISGQAAQFDIFIRLSASKFVRIARAGDGLSVERLRSYQTKEVAHLYLRKPDFARYVSFNMQLVSAVAAKKTGIALQKRVAVCRHAAELVLARLYMEEVSTEAFDDARVFVTSVVSVLAEDRELLELLESMQAQSPELYFHAMAVALYSVLATGKLGWASSVTKFRLTLGGLVHDLGSRELHPRLAEGESSSASGSDRKALERHPGEGAALLATMRSVPDDVLQIIAQHHEHPSGTGYPARLRAQKIHPLARIVSVIDGFCDLVFGPSRASPKAALEILRDGSGGCSVEGDPYGSFAVLGLMRVLGVPVPEVYVELERKVMNSR